MKEKINIDDLLQNFSATELFDKLSQEGVLKKLPQKQVVQLIIARGLEQSHTALPETQAQKPFNPTQIISDSKRLISEIDGFFAEGTLAVGEAEANYLKQIRDAADRIKWTYPAKFQFKKLNRADRCGSLVSGPLFTSEKYPWPYSDEGEPLEPICQLNLVQAGTIGQVALGNGTLQLWMGKNEGFLREISEADLDVDQLSVVPEELKNFVWASPMADRFYGETEPWTHGYVIKGTGRKILTIPTSLMSLIEDGTDKFSNNSIEKAFSAIEKRHRLGGMESEYSGGISYFGNFRTIQYWENERPDALFLIGSGDIFTWGDCGNAQIFFDTAQNGKVTFSFDWSCT